MTRSTVGCTNLWSYALPTISQYGSDGTRRVHVSPVVGRIEREVDNARAHRGRQCESCLEPLSRELRDEQHAVGMGCHVSPGRLEPDRCRVDRIPGDGV